MKLKAGFSVSLVALLSVCSFVYTRIRHNKRKNLPVASVPMSKQDRYVRLLIKWKNAELNGSTLADKLRQEGNTKVAVYGMQPEGVGWLLCNSLINDGIEVAYAIDAKAEKISCLAFADVPDVRLMLPDEKLEPVDMIIVTALLSFDEIKEKLSARYHYRVISLEDLIDEL